MTRACASRNVAFVIALSASASCLLSGCHASIARRPAIFRARAGNKRAAREFVLEKGPQAFDIASCGNKGGPMDKRFVFQVAAVFAACVLSGAAAAQQADMSFFATSTGLGKGGDLGGLSGADAHCQALAQAVGAGGKTWHAYLSTQGPNGVNAKDRIGNGPWKNSKGVTVAANLEELHGNNFSKINKTTALSEKGNFINGRGDTPNQHDLLTGTQQNGTVVAGTDDATCSNWTSSADGQGSAVVGHTDLTGNTQGPNFWNFSHKTPGCSAANLQRVGGAGLFYCFATN